MRCDLRTHYPGAKNSHPAHREFTIVQVASGFVPFSLFLWNDARPAMLVYRHVSQHGFGHPAAYFFAPLAQSPLGVNNNIYCNRCAADLDNIRIKAHHIANEYRLLEHERIYRYRYDAASGPADCRQAPGYVYLRHDPATEDVAGIVSVGGHWHQTQYGITPFRQCYPNFCVSVHSSC
jgi:hypothetical protein